MATAPAIRLESDFDYLVSFLPCGWEEQAKALGALKRCRGVKDAKSLLRVLLIHLAEGCSLRETAVRARQGGLAELSDVAIMDRLRVAGDWFCWINRAVMGTWIARQPTSVFRDRWKIRVVDATRVKEPGPTGSSWCVYYSIDLPSLQCCEVQVHDKHGNGETFRKYHVTPGDLFIGDRAYGTPPGIAHVLSAGGDVLTRFARNSLPLWDETGAGPFDLLGHLRGLTGTRIGDWNVTVKHEGHSWTGRVCALRRSRQATERARRQIKRAAQKHGTSTQAETLDTAGYVFVFTSIARDLMSPSKALEMYRGRWQVELVFKRLKSLLGFGHLRKKDPQAARSWLHGKLLVAFLVEALITRGEALSPWGYPILSARPDEAVPLAGGGADAPSPAVGGKPDARVARVRRRLARNRKATPGGAPQTQAAG